jgi:hypothetical protein
MKMDVKQPYQLGNDNLPILEPFTGPLPPPSESFIRFRARENERERLLLEGYDTFKSENLPKKQVVLAGVKVAMETWFEKGVEYDDRRVDPFFKVSAAALRMKIYTNEPPRLRSALEDASGLIRRHILEAKGIPRANWLDVLIRSPRIRAGDHELKASCGPYLAMAAPFGTVFKTEGLPPGQRAEIVANNWYDVQSERLYCYISLVCNEGSSEWVPHSIGEVEYNYDYERKLRTSGLSLGQQLYCDGRYKRGLYDTEMKDALRDVALNVTLKNLRDSREEILDKWEP